MQGAEKLGTLFEYQLELLSERSDLRARDILGKPITITIELPNKTQRHFHGHVSKFGHAGWNGSLAIYRGTLRPWLWFLTRSANCRIFQDKSVKEILKAVFEEHGGVVEDHLDGTYPPLRFCTQYRETDFNFVSRLMEDVGIYYYVKHTKQSHTLVLADSYTAHQNVKGYENLKFLQGGANVMRDREVILDWSTENSVEVSAYALRDFNFRIASTPQAGNLAARASLKADGSFPPQEFYDYPGGYRASRDGDTVAKRRIEEAFVRHESHQAGTTARGLFAGALFDLSDHPLKDQNAGYLITQCNYNIAYHGYDKEGGGSTFGCNFSAISKKIAYRSQRLTPKPLISGPQTAIVVGPSGEEIWTDKYGRVKVQFHWDREGKRDEKSSCWVRVGQSFAGKKWGSVFLPRIGQEVIVEFLEGDPDQPLITGTVYNAGTMPPFDLPAHATRTVIKTNSSKGGGGFNELRFEDKKGSEQVFVHAEKDYHLRVKHEMREWAGADYHFRVKQEVREWVGAAQHSHVVGDRHVEVGGAAHEKVGGSSNIKVGGSLSIDAASALQQKLGTSAAIQAGTDIHLKAGTNVVIEAGATLTLKVGGSYVVVGPDGVSINGPMVKINSGGSPGSGAGASPVAPVAPTDALEADDGKH